MKFSLNREEIDVEESYVELPSIKSKQNSSKRRLKPIVANLIDTQYDVV